MPASLTITQFRESIGPLFSEAVREHRPLKIDRGRRESGLFLGLDEVLALIQGHEFHPEVYEEAGAISIWLPEFELYGRGASFLDAREDLLGEVRAYVEEYLDESTLYLNAPNRAHHFPHVVKAWLADFDDTLLDALFATPREAAV